MKHLASLLALLSVSTSVLATDFDVKGFIVIDALSVSKQKKFDTDNRNLTETKKDIEEVSTEIITLDLKFYFRHEDWSAKIKLDLDGDLSERNNIYEEALISWRPQKNFKLSAGKGKVPFHQMHFGAARPTYIDGGSILNSSNSWRDQDKKILFTVQNGSYRSGFINQFTYYGNSLSPLYTREDGPDFGRDNFGTISYETTDTLDNKKQRGFANKFTYTPAYGVKYSIAGIYLWRDIDPHADWALDIAMTDANDEREIWFEYMFGFVSKHENDRFTAKKQWEQYIQLGYEYRFNETFSVATSASAILVKALAHDKGDYSTADARDGGSGQGDYNNGQIFKKNNYMLEAALKWRLAKRVNFKLGLTHERKSVEEPRFPGARSQSSYTREVVEKGWEHAWQINSGISYWF
ncbi:hypothetical protein HBN50_07570 [Halobacteriovorax sp. GB3]|uniref:hypothetical protein n=1 Tax=Halobacteriovorax sp. GB3 TaxID=2719615 RepID=UPI00235E7C45|nr:hypothetical protein [Halobacteriovorax sp. GB3]MDD0852949.1 hypothetical protein [Halobacteriovorax sp. GB3]